MCVSLCVSSRSSITRYSYSLVPSCELRTVLSEYEYEYTVSWQRLRRWTRCAQYRVSAEEFAEVCRAASSAEARQIFHRIALERHLVLHSRCPDGGVLPPCSLYPPLLRSLPALSPALSPPPPPQSAFFAACVSCSRFSLLSILLRCARVALTLHTRLCLQ